MFEFLMGNLYFVAIIAFAIFSFVRTRSAKKKSGGQPSGMPTFGGNGDTKRKWFNEPERTSAEPESLDDVQRRYHEAGQRYDELDTSENAPGYEDSATRSTLSSPEPYIPQKVISNQSEVEKRLDEMHRDIQARSMHLNAGSRVRIKELDSETTSKNAIGSEELRKGVIWAEILGEPRAKRPFNHRKYAVDKK